MRRLIWIYDYATIMKLLRAERDLEWVLFKILLIQYLEKHITFFFYKEAS